jgi:hypothetical protein
MPVGSVSVQTRTLVTHLPSRNTIGKASRCKWRDVMNAGAINCDQGLEVISSRDNPRPYLTITLAVESVNVGGKPRVPVEEERRAELLNKTLDFCGREHALAWVTAHLPALPSSR